MHINGRAHFCIFIDYRGHHRKGVEIFNAEFSTKTLVSMKKCIFGQYREVQTIKNQLIDIDFGLEKFFLMTF